jgi:hypothetical protein
MGKPRIKRLGTGVEEPWLLDLKTPPSDPPGVVHVSRILPPGYERYLRLFHPLSLSSDGMPCEPRTWQSVAQDAGLVYHAELQWDNGHS